MANVRSIVFRLWYYYVLATGFSSLYFDSHQKRWLSPRWLRCYSFFTNGLLLLGLPFFYLKGIGFLDAFVEKPLMRIIGNLSVQMHTIAILYALTMRHRHERWFYGVVQHLQRLERTYLDSWAEEASHSYNRLFYAKLLTLCFQNISIMLGLVTMYEKRLITWIDYLLNVYYFIISNYLHSTIFVYFLMQLHISRCFDVLNTYLRRRLHWRLSVAGHGVSVAARDTWLSELRTVLHVHEQLQATVVQLNNLYRLHIASLLVNFFLSNSITFYIAFITLPNWSTKHVFVVVAFLLFAIKSFDIFLINHCCEVLVARQCEVLQIFRQHQHRLDACMEYERMCSDFALNAALSRFSINIYGLFDLNHRTTFAALRNTIMHALILIQFDYIVAGQGGDRQ